MEYIEKWKIKKEDLEYFNNLLNITTLNEYEEDYNKNDIESLNAKKDDYIGIATITFKNDNYITINLASGDNNYYDNIVLWNNKGQEIYCLECSFEISDIEFEYNNDIYKIIIEEVKQ